MMQYSWDILVQMIENIESSLSLQEAMKSSCKASTTTILLDNELADYANDHIYIKEWKEGCLEQQLGWLSLLLLSAFSSCSILFLSSLIYTKS